jgi:hypothetical protein
VGADRDIAASVLVSGHRKATVASQGNCSSTVVVNGELAR